MENRMQTTIERGYLGVCKGYIGIMAKQMEAPI